MPRGFTGDAASLFLRSVSQAHTNATDASRGTPDHAPPGPRTRPLPFEPEEAFTGGRVSTGRGDSTNIVVNYEDYDAIHRNIDRAEDNVGQCLYDITQEIEAMCQTSFILPAAVPRCLNVSDSVKHSLGNMRSMTYETTMEACKFAREITNVGYGR